MIKTDQKNIIISAYAVYYSSSRCAEGVFLIF